SDPPYYTACPNPWIGDFIAEWEAQKPACDEEYHREPFAADVSVVNFTYLPICMFCNIHPFILFFYFLQ
ncbi:hypothetical protein, partial [Citrobacter braakii]|uniref:hypothetical protein n=1 Tax=Citrobacter braakii TaxID=57706 RepID=UPI0037B4EBA9